MSTRDLTALLPLLCVAVASLLPLIVATIRRSHSASAASVLLGLALSIGTIPRAAMLAPRQVTPLLVIDAYALVYLVLIAAASFVVVLLSYGYLETREEHRDEYYALIAIATLGAMVLVTSNHFASLFLGLETLSVSLYGLIAYRRRGMAATEAGLKYLILAGASSAILLFGMALVYTELGTLSFMEMARAERGSPLVLNAGIALIIVGVGFKLALVPFHMWTPDVYQGAPTPVTALLATVSKGAVLALAVRFFYVLGVEDRALFVVFAFLATASMFTGNLLALLQKNVKRILAYSSIAHVGYLMIAFLAGGAIAVASITYYLYAYFLATLAAFGVMTILSGRAHEAEQITDYAGLFWRRPVLATVMTISLLSLAGIPLTAGFVAKFYVVAAGVGAALWWLLFLLVANSAIGLFYYLRIVVSMAARPEEMAHIPMEPVSAPASAFAALVLLAFLSLWWGVNPAPVQEVATVAAISVGEAYQQAHAAVP